MITYANILKKLISSYWKDFKLELIILIFILFLQGLLSSLSVISLAPIVDIFLNEDTNKYSQITKNLISSFEKYGISSNIYSYVFLFLISILFTNFLLVIIKNLSIKIKYSIMQNIVSNSFDTFFKSEWTFFTKNSGGNLLNTFLRDSQLIGDVFGQIGQLWATISKIIIYTTISIFISLKATVFCISLSIFFSLPILFLNKINYWYGSQNLYTGNKLTLTIKELIDCSKIIMAYGNRKKSVQTYINAFLNHKKVTIRAQTLNFSIPLIFEPVGIIALLVTLFFSREIGLRISELVMILWSLKNILPEIGNLYSSTNILRGSFPSYSQLIEFDQMAKKCELKSGNLEFKQLKKSIIFEDINYSYDENNLVLKNINFVLEKGKSYAFVGPSGGGKSTLIDLLLLLNIPKSGNILIDGVKIIDVDVESYRRKIGYVPQATLLFNASIKDNLLWSFEDASEQEIINACEKAYAIDFINELPNNMNTIIGDRGVRLSGGQAQRLSIARALIRNPELIIMDEATSSLDSLSEISIQKAIEGMYGDKTLIIIAHRLSTIRKVDFIFVVENGEIVEQGSYSNLLNQKGIFNRMVKSQEILQ